MKNILCCYKILIIVVFLIINFSKCYSSDSIPLDPSIKYGRLPNGLSYYIKDINNSSTMVNVNLLVKVGMAHEEDGQYQFAHITEHLGLTAGKNFSLQKSSHLLDEAGIKIAQLNAKTSGLHTRYFADISMKNDGALDLALNFFKDTCGNLELNDKNIARERIAVINEAQGGHLSFNLLHNSLELKLLDLSPERPVDLLNHLNTFESQDLIEFYKNWYKPDRMALVIVGDIPDVNALEKTIIEKFTTSCTPERTSFSGNMVNDLNYLSKKPQFIKGEFKNKEKKIEYSPVNLSLFYRLGKSGKKEEYQHLTEELNRRLFLILLNKRFQQKQQDYNSFHAVVGKVLKPPSAFKIDLFIRNGLKKEILMETQQVLKEIKLKGFSSSEFNLGKNEILSLLQMEDTLKNSYWKNEITDYFVSKEALPAQKMEISRRIIQDLDRKPFNEEIKNFLPGPPDDIILVAHEGDPALKFSENEIRAWLKEADNNPVKYTISSKNPDFLMTPSDISELKVVEAKPLKTGIPGARKFQLGNGVEIVFKPVKTKDSVVSFHGFSEKGFNCYSKKDYYSAINAPHILLNSGAGQLDKFELQKLLDTEYFQGYVKPYITASESGIKGSGSINNLETALQLIYLYFTNPGFKEIAFEDWKMNTKLNSMYKDVPTENFKASIQQILPDDELVPEGSEFLAGVDKTEFEKSMQIFHELFNNGNDFSFLFTGDFDVEKLLPLCEKYLGNLPVSDDNVKCLNEIKNSFDPPKPLSKVFYTPFSRNVATVKLVYVKPISIEKFNWREEIKTELLSGILMEQLFRKLRYESEDGGVYMVVSGRGYVISHEYNQIFIRFNCLPTDAERLIREARAVVESIKKGNFDKKLFQKLKKEVLNYQQGNRNIQEKMYNYEKYGKPWYSVSEREEFINSVTEEDLILTAQEYLVEIPFEFKLLPAG